MSYLKQKRLNTVKVKQLKKYKDLVRYYKLIGLYFINSESMRRGSYCFCQDNR